MASIADRVLDNGLTVLDTEAQDLTFAVKNQQHMQRQHLRTR